MNPLDVVLNELNAGGVSVEVKRQRHDGILENTKPNELSTLGTKAKLASTAALLKKLTPEERLEWAVEMKNHGNDFYAQLNFNDAMNTYVEALTAADFGSNSAESSSAVPSFNVLTAADEKKLSVLLRQAAKGLRDDKTKREKQKVAMRKAFFCADQSRRKIE
eukprot:gene23119-29312_t